MENRGGSSCDAEGDDAAKKDPANLSKSRLHEETEVEEQDRGFGKIDTAFVENLGNDEELGLC